MKAEWFHGVIADVCEGIYDGPHATPRKQESGPVFLGISCLDRGRLNLSDTAHLSEADFIKWTRRVTPRKDDVVFSYETRLGEAALIPEGLRCCLGRRMALMRPDPAKVDPKFLLYYFLAPPFQEIIRERTIHGSTVERIALTEFPKFPVSIPPLPIQKRIAHILGTLDDKIELNRRMNETLEAMARALFRSWFVDFDPVRAKMEGRQPVGMDAETAKLFPDSFQDSPLGPIPKEWGATQLRDFADSFYDGPHATPPRSESGAVFLGIKNLTGTAITLQEIRHISEEDWPRWIKRVTPRAGDIVFSYEATLGYFALVPEGLRCCLGRRLALVRPKSENGWPHFMLHWFTARPFQEHIQRHAIHGATVNRTPLTEFPEYPLLRPPDALIERFDEAGKIFWDRIHANDRESRALATLRDTLLPKLLSGELSVSGSL